MYCGLIIVLLFKFHSFLSLQISFVTGLAVPVPTKLPIQFDHIKVIKVDQLSIKSGFRYLVFASGYLVFACCMKENIQTPQKADDA